MGLYVFGYSINVLTLFAMVLAIGIVVDDAIVVVENVERIMTREGLPPREATRKAMDQIFGAIIAITLVLCAGVHPDGFLRRLRRCDLSPVRRHADADHAVLGADGVDADAGAVRHAAQTQSGQGNGADERFLRLVQPFLCPHHPALQVRGGQGVLKKNRPLPGGVCRHLLWRVGWLFVHLPSSFLPDEDQGYFISLIQLPPGATRERSQEVLTEVEQFYLKQPEVEHVIGVAGFSFFGRGQNAAIAFVRLKGWDDRPGRDNSAQTIVRNANMALFRIKQAMIFAINVPPIPELAAVGGFDFRLQDRSGQGRDKLLEARNMALGMASQNPRLVGVRPEGQEPGPQLQIDIDRLKARALGIDIADLNETLQSALGVAYINDFVRQGRILRVQMQAEADNRTTPEQIMRIPVRNAQGGMVPLSEIATPRWVVDLPKLDRFNGLPSMKISGGPAPGRSTGEALAAMEEVAQKLPPGFGFEWSATSYEERLSGQPGAVPVWPSR